MKHHRVLGADREQVQEYYEENVLSILRPKLVVSIACAREKTVVLLGDGNVYEFPKSSLPRLIDLPNRAKGRVEQIAAGDFHFVALTNHLIWNVYTWGTANAEGQLGRIDPRGNDESFHIPGIVKDLPGKVWLLIFVLLCFRP